MVPKGRQRQCGRADNVDSARKCAAGPQRHRKRRSWARRPAHQKKPERSGKQRQRSVDGPLYGALDLGTNNCRLLIAAPGKGGFEVVDAFSRIVRLGEGVSQSGRLSDEAIERTISALRVCANKLKWWNVTRNRLIATEACRMAENGRAFLDRVRDEVGLDLEMADRATEAQLAVAGASPLVCPDACKVLIFDIGGGSTELMWLDITDGKQEIQAWTSIPAGVVTVAEKFGGVFVDDQVFAAMRESVRPLMEQFHNQTRQICDGGAGPCHLLGTSGTVTTLCGIHLNLPRYDRSQVDGCWLDGNDVGAVTRELLAMSHEERASSPCIGKQRADLVMAGCAIFEEIRRLWPSDRIRVADRGLREGILASMMKEDGVYGRTP